MINEKETEARLDFRVLANDTNDLIFSCAGTSCCCMRSCLRSSQTMTITWQAGSCWWRWEPVWIQSLWCHWNLRFDPFWNQLPELISSPGILHGVLGESRLWKHELFAGLRVDFLVPGGISSFSLDSHNQQALAAWSGWAEGPAAPQPLRWLEQCQSKVFISPSFTFLRTRKQGWEYWRTRLPALCVARWATKRALCAAVWLLHSPGWTSVTSGAWKGWGGMAGKGYVLQQLRSVFH